jgi:hypothetical protein
VAAAKAATSGEGQQAAGAMVVVAKAAISNEWQQSAGAMAAVVKGSNQLERWRWWRRAAAAISHDGGDGQRDAVCCFVCYKKASRKGVQLQPLQKL